MKGKVTITNEDKGRPRGIEGIVQGFGPKELQASVQIVAVIKKHGYKWESFESWLKKKVAKMQIPDTLPMMEKIKGMIDRHQITWEEVEGAIHRIKLERQQIKKVLIRHCPDCNSAVQISAINDDPSRMIGDEKFKTWWSCPNCDWEEFSEKNTDEEVKPYLVT